MLSQVLNSHFLKEQDNLNLHCIKIIKWKIKTWLSVNCLLNFYLHIKVQNLVPIT